MRRISVFVALVTLSSSLWSAEETKDPFARVRDVGSWIDLSGATRRVAVLCPDQPSYGKAAQAIADALVKKGVPMPVISSDAARITPQQYNVVALGNVNNNPLIARLYFNFYASENSLLPGEGGVSIRTVFDPYPWHNLGDVVVVGVSDDTGALRAAEQLASRIHAGKTAAGMEHTLFVSTAPPLTDAQRRALELEQTPSLYAFLTSARQYLKTGSEPYADHAIAALGRVARRYRENPSDDCDWPEETNSAEILATWDAFEECARLSAEQRREATWVMLRFLRTLVKHVSGYAALGKNDLVTWNHTTFPMLGLYFGSRYFQDYYRLPEASIHLEKARACLLAQSKSWKPQEDADSYLTITMGHTLQYCLAEWNLEFCESGRLRQYADYVIGICDSAGFPSGFGDSGLGKAPTLLEAALPVAFWWYRDPEYLWILQQASDGKWRNPFHRDVPPREPQRHTGVRVFPLDSQLYEFTKSRRYYAEPVSPPNVPAASAFDKISFRESWQKNSQYLLLDGFARGKHLHYDGNAIIEYVDRGRRWLIDHDYLTRNTTEHNMLSVVRDGRSEDLVPSCAAVVCQADLGGRIGLVGTEIRDYCGIDWRRAFFWQKGDAFVVMDRMTARAASSYDLDLMWKVEDQNAEQLAGSGEFVVRRSAVPARSVATSVIGSTPPDFERFWIKWPDDVQPSVTRAAPKGIVVPVCKLRQRISGGLQAGESVEVANLLYTDDSTSPKDLRMERLAPGAVFLHGTEDALCALRGAAVPGVEFDAEMLYLSASRLVWANGRSFRWRETTVTSDRVSHVELDAARAGALARTADGQPATIAAQGFSAESLGALLGGLRGTGKVSTKNERGPRPEAANPNWRVSLDAGNPVRRLVLADLDQDGKPEILVAAGMSAAALRANGTSAWTYALRAACFDVAAGELHPNKGWETVIAGGDAHAHLLDSAGRLINTHPIRGAVWNQNFGDRPWDAYTVAVRDLDRDARNEILVGTQNFELHCYDPSWKLLWKARRAVLHGSIDFHLLDADRDGNLEVVATDHYGYVTAYRHNGKKVGSFYTSIGDAQAVLGDLDGDERVELVYGSSTGDLRCAKIAPNEAWQQGPTLWQFNNFGYGVNRLRCDDLDGDGKKEIVLASQTGYLYVLDGQGRVRWQDLAGTEIVEAVVLSGAAPRIAYFDAQGVLTLASGDGLLRKRVRLNLVPRVALQLGDSLVVGAGSDVVSYSITELWSRAAK
jgi:hypothetical protein